VIGCIFQMYQLSAFVNTVIHIWPLGLFCCCLRVHHSIHC